VRVRIDVFLVIRIYKPIFETTDKRPPSDQEKAEAQDHPSVFQALLVEYLQVLIHVKFLRQRRRTCVVIKRGPEDLKPSSNQHRSPNDVIMGPKLSSKRIFEEKQ
jgi:hypothetical protein